MHYTYFWEHWTDPFDRKIFSNFGIWSLPFSLWIILPELPIDTEGKKKDMYLNMVSVYDFTCVDQQLYKLTVGHQELGDQVDVPVSKK